MTTAFQGNAFQNNAFQIDATVTISSGDMGARITGGTFSKKKWHELQGELKAKRHKQEVEAKQEAETAKRAQTRKVSSALNALARALRSQEANTTDAAHESLRLQSQETAARISAERSLALRVSESAAAAQAIANHAQIMHVAAHVWQQQTSAKEAEEAKEIEEIVAVLKALEDS